MNRTEIIQILINKINAENYLEIGIGPGVNFSNVNCKHKISVDPYPYVPVTLKMTSDDFFKENKEKFDVIFIDGLHWSEQVYRDIINSLETLNDGGYIVCHDINPHSEIIQKYPQEIPGEWTGDCWKSWVKLKSERNDLNMYVVDTDYGCGIITKGKQEIIEVTENLTWEFLDKNRKKILNLISVDDFKNMFHD